MLSDVESDMHTEFHSRCFFNEWLEKNEIMRNQFQEPKLHRQPEEFCGFFKRSSCFGCSTWGSRKFDKIFR